MPQITLEAARVNVGYSQRIVAEKLGVHHQTVSKYERDSSKIPIHLLKKMCELYKIEMDNIFLGKKYEK